MEALPLAEPEPELMPEEAPEEPELVPGPWVLHAANAKTQARGIVHFNIKILLKNKSLKHEIPLMPKMHACE